MVIAIIMLFNIFFIVSDYKAKDENFKIVIDAGHGGMDTGAFRGDVYESEITLKIALKLEEVLESNGYSVLMTRNDMNALCKDKFIKKEDMDNRLNVINSANTLLGVSIHLNEFGIKKYHGAQVFYSNSISESYDLALNIQKSLQYYLKNTDRSIVKRDNVYLLNRASIPFCIVECGFMSNDEEFELLVSDAYQYKMANVIFYGIEEYIKEKRLA